MRILTISDTPERLLYDSFSPERWRGNVDVILSCGDLDREYLEFLVSMLDVPLYYVAGNHDTSYRVHAPEGCEELDERVITIGGLRIAGISGSSNYNSGPEGYQFSERQMAWRMRKLGYKVWRAGGVDIVISHAAPIHCPSFGSCPAPAGIGKLCSHHECPAHLETCLDAGDRAHLGFECFRRFILRYRPTYWLHGHNHLTYSWAPRISTIDDTTVINSYGHYLLDTEERQRVLPITAAASSALRPS